MIGSFSTLLKGAEKLRLWKLSLTLGVLSACSHVQPLPAFCSGGSLIKEGGVKSQQFNPTQSQLDAITSLRDITAVACFHKFDRLTGFVVYRSKDEYFMRDYYLDEDNVIHFNDRQFILTVSD